MVGAAVIPFESRLRAQFVVLELVPLARPRIPFGILLLDPRQNRFDWKLRDDVEDLPLEPEDAEYVACLNEDFKARIQELGGMGFLESLEESLSGFVQISEREVAVGKNFDLLLTRLFDEHVDRRIRRYVTHLPLYGVRAAATKFGEDTEVDESEVEWVRAPEGMRLSEDQFVAQVVGRSMEPLIPDGSLVVFRKVRPGSRQGKRLLIEELGATGSSARFTVKRYTSTKSQDQDSWAHDCIRLEPLNAEFPAFDLDPEAFEGRYRVIGEFVQVLSSPE